MEEQPQKMTTAKQNSNDAHIILISLLLVELTLNFSTVDWVNDADYFFKKFRQISTPIGIAFFIAFKWV